MSIQNIIDRDDTTTEEALNEYFKETSMNLLKNLRFGVGKVYHDEMREMLRLQETFTRIDGLDKEQKDRLRERILRKTISRTHGLSR